MIFSCFDTCKKDISIARQQIADCVACGKSLCALIYDSCIQGICKLLAVNENMSYADSLRCFIRFMCFYKHHPEIKILNTGGKDGHAI